MKKTEGIERVERYLDKKLGLERFWLRLQGLSWQEASREQFIRAEHSAGFFSKFGSGELATGGFNGGGVEGRITRGPINAENCSDPEFLKDAEAAGAVKRAT